MSFEVRAITLEEVCRVVTITREQILLIVEEGIVEPEGGRTTGWSFTETQVLAIKKACRLHHDLNLSWDAIALIMDLLEEKAYLEREVERLTLKLRRFE